MVEQVDAVGPQPFQRGLADRPDMLGPAVHAALASAVDVDAELGGDDDFIADRRQRLADDLLVLVRPVDLCGVENVTPRSNAARISLTASGVCIGSP